jgi:hypothetical protein
MSQITNKTKTSQNIQHDQTRAITFWTQQEQTPSSSSGIPFFQPIFTQKLLQRVHQ